MRQPIPLLCALTLWLCTMPSGRAQAIPARYTLTDLGTLGGTQSIAYGINAKGQVVGSAHTTAEYSPHAFLWENGTMTDLGTLGGPFFFSYAMGLNARGQVVGDSASDRFHRAFLWENGNERGQVVGSSSTAAWSQHAFLWENGAMTDLGTLGGAVSFATGINGRGQIVGYSSIDIASSHAFLWEDGKMTDLGTLGGPVSVPTGINERGQIVGHYSDNTGGPPHAFLATP